MNYFRTDFTSSKGENLSENLFIPSHLHEGRLTRAVELFQQYAPKVTVLDVGCGYGHLYPLITSSVSHYKGLDPDPTAVQKATEEFGLHFSVGRVEDLNLSHSADIVFCLGVACFLQPTEEALTWFIEQLCHVGKQGVIIEFQDAQKYSGHFTSFSKDQVSKACQRAFNRSTLKESIEDSTFQVRIPLR